MDSIINNPDFSQETRDWYAQAGGDATCKLRLCDRGSIQGIFPSRGLRYALVEGRQRDWNGLAQDINGRLQPGVQYKLSADVSISGAGLERAKVKVTLSFKDNNGWVKPNDGYVHLGSVEAVAGQWVHLEGILAAPDSISPRVTLYVEGPPKGVDILVDYITLTPKPKAPAVIIPKPGTFDPKYGINIVENGDMNAGKQGWQTMAGSEKINVVPAAKSGSPAGPPALPSSLTATWPTAPRAQGATRQETLSELLSASSLGSKVTAPLALVPTAGPTSPYMVVSNRKATWQGPCQMLTARVKPFVTYALTSWVKIGSCTENHTVEWALSVNNKWATGAQVEASPLRWTRCWGSFRVETEISSIKHYCQGPPSGVDLWLADVRVVAVDCRTNVEELRKRTDLVRKRDVALRVVDSNGNPVHGVVLSISQRRRAFPLGTCLSDSHLRDPQYQQFFLQHFNFAVFENELKWTWNEPREGCEYYKEADQMLTWLEQHQVKARGHCLLWDNGLPSWVKALPDPDLAAAVKRRVTSAVTRYRGRLMNWDLNNEMLHGGYLAERLGPGIITSMFQLAHSLDPTAQLFLNDYHVEDGCDAKSRPEKLAEQARNLLVSCAPVGGIGIQCHITAPVGAHIRAALDELAQVGLPLWLTEVDVESVDETLRAADLEVVLREAYAHPAVQGIVLWGFWENGMYRKNAHLAARDWKLTEAGRLLEALLEEWTTPEHLGRTDGNGTYAFRGFHGSYLARVRIGNAEMEREFSVVEGRDTQYATVQL